MDYRSLVHLYSWRFENWSLTKVCTIVVAALYLVSMVDAEATELPVVTKLNLEIRFHLIEQRVDVVAKMTIRNSGENLVSHIPFLLYRLFTVDRVAGNSGRVLAFHQNILALSDEPTLQAVAVTVDLPSPLPQNDSTTLVIEYSGFMYGYPEVMQYVKDRVDEEYALLRPDAFAFPVLAEPTYASAMAAYDHRFSYKLTATVPASYRVACGGEPMDVRTGGDTSIYIFNSKVPSWRLDIAVAKFDVIDDPANHLTVNYRREDSVGARCVLEAARRVISLYSGMFGKPPTFRGYTVIEIPEGWGSQAGDFYFLQTAAAFEDTSRMYEVYHEIGHTWNATSSTSVQRCRYFDEAFASFFQALAIRAFNGDAAFEAEMERSRASFSSRVVSDTLARMTAIAQYGTRDLGRYSYSKGAWSLYVLHELVGESAFNSIISSLVRDYATIPIDFSKFEDLCEQATHRNLGKFFQEWIFGTESSVLLTENVPIAEIVKRYK